MGKTKKNKRWPDNTKTKKDTENETEIDENVKDVTKLCQSIPVFQDYDKTDDAKWLNIDANDTGYEILNTLTL